MHSAEELREEATAHEKLALAAKANNDEWYCMFRIR